MLRRSIATPCPVNSSLDDILRGGADDTTTTFDFTTEFRASLRNAKPRRKQRPSVQFSIHEDQVAEEDAQDQKRTALSQPPRRIKPTHSLQISASEGSAAQERQELVSHNDQPSSFADGGYGPRLGQAPRRPAARLSVLPESATKDITAWLKPPSPKAARPARRGTIFIPNDDTTMPSMYMGIFSPIKNMDLEVSTIHKEEQRTELVGTTAETAVKRRARMSMIGTAPRRAPLQQNVRPIQETLLTTDRHGQGGGKENVPPGATEKDSSHNITITKGVKCAPRRTSLFNQSSVEKERSNLAASTKCSMLRQEAPRAAHTSKPVSRPAWNGGANARRSQPVPTVQKATRPAPSRHNIAVQAAKPKVPTRFVVPAIQPEPVLQNHALLAEDLVNPALYENDWLQHQEIAMTQLVNNLFSASQFDEDYDHWNLRRQLIKVYNASSVALIHKRLQAALLYGSLSVSQDALRHGARLQSDVGLKKQFTDLWLCTYELPILEAALEAVVGRECCSPKLRTSEGCSSSSTISKSRLRNFIETFIIRNEDGKPDQDAKSRISWSYQRTVLRSLMLIKVLDLVKTDRAISVKSCLFQPLSPFKSSVSVLQALMQMLNPTVGDPTRVLGHIDYKVAYVQHPLQEFNYHIDNLAVDLRDGIRLTRIVELLLYPSASHTLEKSYDIDSTTTLLLPEGETLVFSEGQDWPLSQHLKVPCHSRAVRIWNVRVALSAVRNVKGMGDLVDGISADDIVDGFREKTIKLLWALVGKWGLVGLLNWYDLRWEIKRLERLCPEFVDRDDGFDEEVQNDDLSFESCKVTLKRWARAVAFSKGVTIHNFTTSFADGKAFEAIVHEYERYIDTQDSSLDRKGLLQDRLSHLGCSAQFSQLFAAHQTGHVFDRDFVLASLAFLCSRLLAPTRRARAANVIQKAWRKHWSKIADARRQEMKNVALACAEKVKAKLETNNMEVVADTVTAVISPRRSPLAHTNNPQGPLSPSAGDEDIWLTL